MTNRASPDFAGQVNRMFDRVAGHYDALNSVMTAGLHHRWRERAADRTELGPGDAALDVCCGTGDLAFELAGRVAPSGRVVGCDFSEPMLDLARDKAAARGADGVRFEWADALELPYDGDRFDAVTVGFGVRNLADLDRGLREMAPGAEARAGAWSSSRSPSRPGRRSRPSSRSGSTASCRCSAPSPSEPEAYTYLPESVRSFPSPARPGGEDGPRRLRADPLHGPRRRDHRDPHAALRGLMHAARPYRRRSRRSSTPPSRWLPARMGEVEDAAAGGDRRPRRAARRGRRRDPGGGRQAAAADAGPALRRRGRRRGGGARRDRDRARPHGDPGPRRRARRGAAAARAADRRRHLRPRPRARHRRPAALARLRPARRGRRRALGAAARRRRGGARPRRAGPAPGRLRPGDHRSALPRPLPAEDGDAVRMRLPARPRRRGAARASAPRSGSPSSCSTTCSTSPGRRSGPARRAAPTCSTAPSPCR